MKELHAISFIGLIYSVVLALITLIFFREYLLFPVLGSAVSLFNHSQMIHATKHGLKTERVVVAIVQRYIMYLIIIVFVYFDTKNQEMSYVTTSYVFLLLGFIATKMGIYIYHSPLIKKKIEEKAVEENDSTD
jgi:SNF family Na+-dependent transporter